ncbi:hypothetical protein PsorP6_001520 [Peronosclerospora sorghi]|uniref:Uncharacterized protein n=1 Tax=Peronosclerospora sorghi TaxID=230839 RepID=A0ACC0WQW0_9STRA|nr:hypothetical protein PsorP6_001520 [Peronosclerospora sorghi]
MNPSSSFLTELFSNSLIHKVLTVSTKAESACRWNQSRHRRKKKLYLTVASTSCIFGITADPSVLLKPSDLLSMVWCCMAILFYASYVSTSAKALAAHFHRVRFGLEKSNRQLFEREKGHGDVKAWPRSSFSN